LVGNAKHNAGRKHQLDHATLDFMLFIIANSPSCIAF
jgi:hypothetical protein